MLNRDISGHSLGGCPCLSRWGHGTLSRFVLLCPDQQTLGFDVIPSPFPLVCMVAYLHLLAPSVLTVCYPFSLNFTETHLSPCFNACVTALERRLSHVSRPSDLHPPPSPASSSVNYPHFYQRISVNRLRADKH